MKLILFGKIFSLLFAFAIPQQSQNVKNNQGTTQLSSENVIDYLVNVLLQTSPLNYPELPENFKTMPASQLSNCVSELHYAIIDVCIQEMDDPALPTGERSLKILQCAFEAVTSHGAAKKNINKGMAINAFIGITSLPEDKKKSAKLETERCLNQDKIHLPKSMHNHGNLGKAMICVSKALVKNDCHLAPRQ